MKVSKHSFVVVGTSSLLTAVTGGGRGSRITASLSWVQLALLKRKGGGGMVGPISRPSVGWRSQGYRCRGNRSCDSRRDTFHIPVARDRHNNNNAQKAMQFHGSCCRCLGFRSFFRVSFVQQYADPDVKDRIHHHTGVMIAIAIGTLGRSTISSWKASISSKKMGGIACRFPQVQKPRFNGRLLCHHKDHDCHGSCVVAQVRTHLNLHMLD